MEQVQVYYEIAMQRLEGWYQNPSSIPTALYLTGAAFVMTALLWTYSSTNNATNDSTKRKKSGNKRKKMQAKTAPLSKGSHIDIISKTFHNEYKQGLLQLVVNYNAKDEKNRYDRRYYNEMLLKLLIELDGIDITALPTEEKLQLKNKRKAVIKEIQTHLQLLDTLPRN